MTWQGPDEQVREGGEDSLYYESTCGYSNVHTVEEINPGAMDPSSALACKAADEVRIELDA